MPMMRTNNNGVVVDGITSPHSLLVVLVLVLLLPSLFLPSVGGEVSMGTTILAVRYDGGVVAGADTRTSSSGYVTNRYAAKLTFVLDGEVDEFTSSTSTSTSSTSGVLSVAATATVVSRRRRRRGRSDVDDNSGGEDDHRRAAAPSASTCVICRSGSAADTQHLASIVRTELVSRRLLHRTRGTVTHAASLLRNLLAENVDQGEEMSASLVCAGYDHELRRGVIYSIGTNGAMFEERDWAVAGSGSTYVLGHLDSHYHGIDRGYDDDDDDRDDEDNRDRSRRRLPSEEEALEFVYNAIRLAMERDGSSGGYVRMYVIDKFGRRYVSRTTNNANDDGRGGRRVGEDGAMIAKTNERRGAAVALSNFSPAASPTVHP